jgi:hypothetical protein
MLRRVAIVRTDVSEDRRFLQEPHGVTSQKTPFFMIKQSFQEVEDIFPACTEYTVSRNGCMVILSAGICYYKKEVLCISM